MSATARQVPENWESLTFEQAIEPVTDEGKRVDRSDYLSEGSLPVIDQGEEFIGGYTNDTDKRYDGPLPVIVFGDHTRRVKLVDFPFVVGAQGVKLLKPKDCWEPRFLAYLLPTLPLPDRGYGRHYQYLRQLKFSCPPRPLQHEIVAEIEKQFTRLEAGVAGLRRVQANLKRYRAAVLKAACEGKLVPTEAELARQEGRSYETGAQLLERILTERRQKWKGKGKYKEPSTLQPESFADLPDAWTWTTAEQLTTIITDGEHITPRRTSAGVLLLSARNVLEGRISIDDVDFVPQDEYDRIARRLVINPGDVLLSCSGSVGRSAVVPEGLTFTLVRSVAVLKPVLRMGKYLSIALRSPFLRSQILQKQTQTAQANIFQGKIKTLVVPLPPLVEQQRIVAEVERRLSVVEELEAVVNANLQRATRLRQSILQRAFEGNLAPGYD